MDSKEAGGAGAAEIGQAASFVKGGQVAKGQGPAAKWVVLFLSSFVSFSAYFALDVPSAVQERLRVMFGASAGMDFEVFFGLTYSLYSFPNMILPFFGGFLTSRFGAAYTTLGFTVIVLLGQVLTTFGIYLKLKWLVLFGRTFFGLGGESLCVSTSALVAEWFLGANVALAMGMALSLSRLGSVMNDVVSPALSIHAWGVTGAFVFATFLLVLSTLASLVVYRMDQQKRASLRLAELSEEEKEDTQVSWFASLRRFPLMFWVLCVSCLCVYGVVIPWNSVAQGLLIERECGGTLCCPAGQGNDCDAYRQAEQAVSLQMTITFSISAIAVPLVGYGVDRFGFRAWLTMGASVLLFIVHFVLALSSSVSAVPLLIVQGLAYSVYAAALWPSIPLIIPERQVGLAYGVITAIQNLGLCVFPLVVAAIKGHQGSFGKVEYFFALLAAGGVVSAAVLNWLDTYRANRILNATTLETITSSSKDAPPPMLKEDRIDDLTHSSQNIINQAFAASRQSLEESEHRPLLADS